MKGTPQFPMCGFSGQVVQILDYLGVSYKGLNVLENDELRQGVKAFSNWPTIPQLYVKGESVGGCDIIREMFQAGELQSLLKDKGLAVKEAAATGGARRPSYPAGRVHRFVGFFGTACRHAASIAFRNSALVTADNVTVVAPRAPQAFGMPKRPPALLRTSGPVRRE